MDYAKPLTLIAGLLATSAVAQAEPKEWTLDIGHAYVGWEIDHMNLSPTVGQFRDFDGKFLIDEADPTNSKITFTVQTASIDSNHPGRDNHLRNADYFDVATYPEMTFDSTEVQLLTPTSGKLHGDLTLRGVTAPLTLDFRMVRDAHYPEFIPNYDQVRVIGFEAEASCSALIMAWTSSPFSVHPPDSPSKSISTSILSTATAYRIRISPVTGAASPVSQVRTSEGCP